MTVKHKTRLFSRIIWAATPVLALGISTAPALGMGPADACATDGKASVIFDSHRLVELQANVFMQSTQENAALAFGPGGDGVVVWDSRRQERGSYGVFAQRFDGVGRPVGSEFHVNVTLAGLQRRPDVALDPESDHYWFVWESSGQDGSGSSIVARRFNNKECTTEAPAEIAVNDTRLGDQLAPSVAPRPGGGALVVWTDTSRGADQARVMVRAFASDGSPTGPEQLLGSNHVGYDRDATITKLGTTGLLAVVWSRINNADDTFEVHGCIVDANGVVSGDGFVINGEQGQSSVADDEIKISSTTIDAIEPTIAADATGRFVVAWHAGVEDGYRVMARRFDSNGQPLGDALVVAEPSDGWKSGATAVAAADGRFGVLYNTQANGADGEDINGRFYGRDGQPLHDGFKNINAHTTGRQYLTGASGAHRVQWDEQDRLAVAWNGASASGDRSAANLTLLVPSELADAAPELTEAEPRLAAMGFASDDFLTPIPPIWDPNYVPQQPLIGAEGDGPDFGFEGVPGTGWTPPDPEMAVGPEHLMVIVNGQIACFTKDGVNLWREPIENSFGFWGALGTDNFVFDPEVCWDPHEQRFWAMACERSDTRRSNFLLAVSKDDRPETANDWWKYRLDVTTFAGNDIDSPNMGLDDEAVYLTADFFVPDKYLVFAVDKSSVLNGGTAQTNHHLITGTQSYGIPVMYDANAPAQYMIQSTEFSNNNQVIFHALTDPMGSFNRQTVSLSVPSYTYPNQPPQRGSSSKPFLFEPRFWSCVQRGDSIWAVHHVNRTRARARWYEFDMNGWPAGAGTPSIAQWGEIDLGGGIHTFFPSISADDEGNAAITFARSATDEYISMGRAVRAATDPLNTFRDPVIVKESQAAHNSGRWGDYSGTQADDFEEDTFWGHHEFTPNGSWRTWVAQYIIETGMVLDVGPLVPGQLAELEVTGATPDGMVYFTYSRFGLGSTSVPQLNVTLDLNRPQLAGSARADANGTALYSQTLGGGLPSIDVWIQAAEFGNTSNVVQARIQ